MSGVQGMVALSPNHCCKVDSAVSGLPCFRREDQCKKKVLSALDLSCRSLTFGAILLTISDISTTCGRCLLPRLPVEENKQNAEKDKEWTHRNILG